METGIEHRLTASVQDAMPALARCGFQPFGNATQGSGYTGRALSADGMTWAELVELRSGLRGSLRQLLGKGVLRGAGCTAQFTSEFSNGDCLVTATAPLEPAEGVELELLPMDTPIAAVALRHMQRIDAALLHRHPLKLRIHCDAGDVARAKLRLRDREAAPATQPLSAEALRELGVPGHLARIIAGDCADTADLSQ